MEASKVAGEVMAQAARTEEASFNAQHALAREGELATGRLQAAAQQAQQRVAAERAREERRHAEAARFDPEDLDDLGPPVYVPPAPRPSARRDFADDLDDDDEPPASWLT